MKTFKEKQFKILAVDDNPKNIQIIGSVLREAGYAVGFAFEGQQALTLLKDSTDYDLVLLDVNMPVMNGFETCKALRKNEKLKEIPVIFLTALNDPDDIIAGFDAGGQDYVTKPFNSKELLSRVKTHLDLKNSKDKLAEANQHLEKRVLERTKELNKAKLKAEESDTLKSTFLALMNHEIRTPLNAILGFSTIIAESNQDVDSLKFSQIIHAQTDLLLKLVDDIIDSAQIESGSMRISNETFSLNELLNELLVIYEAKSPSEVSLISKTPFEEIFINADKTRIKQIFTNLILNAIKFTPEGTVTFGYDVNKESEIVCFVKDTGIGISNENHHEIFERFTKLDSFSQGTGLGLSIVKNIVELLEGKIWIESELKKGATFYFELPFKIVKSANQKTISKNVIPGSPKKFTILIAEDEESNFIYLNELLDADNFNVIHAINGKEAVDQCARNKEIGLVLMDINMPVLNGYEATKKIKKINPELPIIAQTAYTLPENKEAAKEAGFDGFLSKPIKKSDLLEWIRIFS